MQPVVSQLTIENALVYEMASPYDIFAKKASGYGKNVSWIISITDLSLNCKALRTSYNLCSKKKRLVY